MRVRCIAGWAATAAVISMLPVAGARAADEVVGMKPGMFHPDVRLPRLGGGFSRISDFRGERVLLIHFASW